MEEAMKPMPENRYWILNPVGHRLTEQRGYYGRDGEEVETVFGPATLIVPPQPPVDEWYCDMCSEPILVKWGDEPFPVPMFGSYALCAEHYEEAKGWHPDDERTGDPIPSLVLGEWPGNVCRCQPCTSQTVVWRAQLLRAYVGEAA
jgi:hypothetical protein